MVSNTCFSLDYTSSNSIMSESGSGSESGVGVGVGVGLVRVDETPVDLPPLRGKRREDVLGTIVRNQIDLVRVTFHGGLDLGCGDKDINSVGVAKETANGNIDFGRVFVMGHCRGFWKVVKCCVFYIAAALLLRAHLIL